MPIDHERSEAVILYLGKGLCNYPRPNPQRVTERFGEEVGLDLVQYVQATLDELYGVQPDWSTSDLAAETEKAVQRVRKNHPEPSDEALAAPGWSFNFDWK
jgi:hypothetical protein